MCVFVCVCGERERVCPFSKCVRKALPISLLKISPSPTHLSSSVV